MKDRPPRRKCARPGCERMTQSRSGLCPDHIGGNRGYSPRRKSRALPIRKQGRRHK